MKNTNTLVPYLLVMPGFILGALVVLWPVFQLTEISFSEVNRFGQIKGFGGFENYASVLSDPDFLTASWRTVLWTIGIVGGSVALSLPIAMMLHQDFYGRSLARIIVMLPWAMSITMTAIVWRWALNGESGMLNSGLRSLGIIDHNVQWLAQAGTAFPMQILIGITVTVPFTVTILLGGLSSVGDDIYEAAKLEGASGWQVFKRITLPLMRPFLNIALVLNTIYVFNSFPIIWATTQGGPANSTDILVTYLYKLGFRYGRLGDASALSLMMFLLLLVLLIFYVRLVSRRERAQ